MKRHAEDSANRACQVHCYFPTLFYPSFHLSEPDIFALGYSDTTMYLAKFRKSAYKAQEQRKPEGTLSLYLG